MLVEMQIEILNGQSSGLFSNEPCEKRPVMTIEDFDFHFDDRFESHLLRNGLCTHISHMCDTHMCDTHICDTHMCDTHMCDTHMCDTHMCDTHMCGTHMCH